MNFEDRIIKTISEAKRKRIDRGPISRPGEFTPEEIHQKALEAANRLAKRKEEREHIAPGLPGPEEEPLPPGREEEVTGVPGFTAPAIPKRPVEPEEPRSTVIRPEDPTEEEALEQLRRLEAETGASFPKTDPSAPPGEQPSPLWGRPERPELSKKPLQKPSSKPFVVRKKRFPRSKT